MKMLIVIDGGCIRSIYTDREVEVTVSDHDCLNVGEESISHPEVTVVVPIITDQLIQEQEQLQSDNLADG